MVTANQDLTILFFIWKEKKALIQNKFKFTSDFIVKNNDFLYSRVTCGEAPACSDGRFAKWKGTSDQATNTVFQSLWTVKSYFFQFLSEDVLAGKCWYRKKPIQARPQLFKSLIQLALVVQKLDSAIHQINCYSADK